MSKIAQDQVDGLPRGRNPELHSITDARWQLPCPAFGGIHIDKCMRSAI
jgi:hypothetical protein